MRDINIYLDVCLVVLSKLLVENTLIENTTVNVKLFNLIPVIPRNYTVQLYYTVQFIRCTVCACIKNNTLWPRLMSLRLMSIVVSCLEWLSKYIW